MNELPCPYCGFNCEVPSGTEEQIECPECRSIFLYIQNSQSHGTIDYRPAPEINDRGRRMTTTRKKRTEYRKEWLAVNLLRNKSNCVKKTRSGVRSGTQNIQSKQLEPLGSAPNAITGGIGMKYSLDEGRAIGRSIRKVKHQRRNTL